MNDADSPHKHLEAEQLIRALIDDINAPRSRDIDALLTQMSALSKRLFGEQNRYLRQIEDIRPFRTIQEMFDQIRQDARGAERDIGEAERDRMLALCRDMLSEVRSFRNPSLSTAGMPTEGVLVFEDSDLPLNIREFTEFLHLFRAAYIFGMNFRDVAPESITPELHSEFIQILQQFGTDGSFDELISADLAEQELLFTKISKNSPLEIITQCIIPALTVAVIVSGGIVELPGGFKFKLPALGDGIKKLREAFGLRVNKKQQIQNLQTRMKRTASISASNKRKETSSEEQEERQESDAKYSSNA